MDAPNEPSSSTPAPAPGPSPGAVPTPAIEAMAPASGEGEAFRRLDRRVVRWWRWSLGIRWMVTGLLMGGVACFLLRGQEVAWRLALAAVPVPAVVLATLFGGVMPKVMYRHFRYRVDDRELRILQGVIVRTDTLVRLSRVQYVEVRRGLLERGFGLASLVVHTAAAEAASLVIPGLDDAEAERLRAHLIALIDDDRL